MKLQNEFSCVECGDVITNPVCPDCLAAQMQVMVGERDSLLAREIKGSFIPGGSLCAHCGQEMGLCAHCFSKDVYQFILENDPMLAREFLTCFDFDLRRVMIKN